MDYNPKRQQRLIELYRLLVKQWKAEQAYDRAQWRVSYYRKLKTKLENSKKTSEKWSDLTDLTKKIERERLCALKKQQQLAKLKLRNAPLISNLKTSLLASFVYDHNHKIIGIWTPDTANRGDGHTLNAEDIYAAIDQYDANEALTKALEDNSKL